LGYQVQLNPNTVQNYIQNSAGFTVFASYPVRRLGFTRIGLTYGFTSTSITGLSTAATALFNVLQFQQLAGPSSLSGIRESKVTPTITYNTVNNPVNPTSGKSLFLSSSFEGGPIGGNVNTVSEIVEAKYFRPNYHKRNVIAMRVLGAFETGFSGKVVPPFSRYYLGGEDTLRGFDVRTVSPAVFVPTLTTTRFTYSINGTPTTVSIPTLSYQTSFPGGDTQFVGNFEYRIPIAPHVSMSIFGDAGTTGALLKDQLQLNSTEFTTLSNQFSSTANISQTLLFAPGTNFKPRISGGLEVVVQLPIVQAPFRLYWAYNFDRVAEVITAPSTVFPGPANTLSDLTSICVQTPSGGPNQCPWNIWKAQFPAGYWNNIVAPAIVNQHNNPQRTNFFDPIRTLRFTVSRTF
jgi:outer membrane protein insertion porin family